MTNGNIDTPTQNDNGIRFSVIIPVYNNETTIARAIESVLSQSYQPYEIIVVDDASKDNTQAIVQSGFTQSVRYIQKITNSGGSVARNTGMDAATGDYIAFLDADDIWHKDKLLLLNNILLSKPGIHLFYHPYTMDDINDKALPENIILYKLPFVKLLPANTIATSCAIIRNDPSFRFEPSMRYTEDYDLWLRIGYKYKIFFVNIPLSQIFRPFLSKGGVSEKRWKMRKGEIRAYWRLTKLNPLFIFLFPFLLISSIGKYLYKLVFRK